MSVANTTSSEINEIYQANSSTKAVSEWTKEVLLIDEVVEKTCQKIAPMRPLKDYVAVNPYSGFAAQSFLSTREYLRSLSDLEFFMPVDFYREQLAEGLLCRSDISAAVDELVIDGVAGAERIDVNQVVALLLEKPDPSPTSDSEFRRENNLNRSLFTITETIDRHTGSNWSHLIRDEISKHCASHYDQGQAVWKSASQSLQLYSAWRSDLRHDRNFEILGVSGFRKFVAQLPHDGRAALVYLLNLLGLPEGLWEDYLLCMALTLPGWSAWAKYHAREAEKSGQESSDFVDLLAIRLAYDAGLSRHLDFHVAWSSVATQQAANRHGLAGTTDHDLLRYALLKASEIAIRNRLIANLSCRDCEEGELHKSQLEIDGETQSTPQSLAQMVFCIDVRSERIRRHLESSSAELETFGFAGFFGVPMEFVELGADTGTANVPALITPQFKVHEAIGERDLPGNRSAIHRRKSLRFLRKACKEFQSSAVGMFAFVEATGLLFGWKLLAKSFGWARPEHSRYDGVNKSEQCRISPTLEGLVQQGIDTARQTDIAESILRGIGIVENFARLVVFCGHGSQVENNPLKAGLDCGACGGHSGEPNARLAAKLLNQPQIRSELAQRGICIPTDTHFVAALHNTTTDEISFLDEHEVPNSHFGDLEQLSGHTVEASQLTRKERLLTLASRDARDLYRRSEDWSEVRPEWGLAGNATFIAAPRELTQEISLNGQSFLHSYNFRHDRNYSVLEQILTAPLVVANWINMQYFASTGSHPLRKRK